jgi:hypothetical protein
MTDPTSRAQWKVMVVACSVSVIGVAGTPSIIHASTELSTASERSILAVADAGPAEPQLTGQQHGKGLPGTEPRMTTNGFSIPRAHPRLWWTPTRLAQARTWLADHPFTPGATDYLHVAWKHVVAGTDCSPAVAWAMNHQVPARQYSANANGSDIARWTGEDAFIVYDWCHDQLTSEQRLAFLGNIAGTGKGWNDYLTGISQQQWGGPHMKQNNYNWGNLRNNIEYAIATYSENTVVAESLLADAIVTRWMKNFVPSTTAGGAGGVGQEGSGYAAALGGYPIIPFLTMKAGGRDIYNETAYFKQMALWLVYSTTPTPTFNVGTRKSSYQLNTFSDDELYVEGGILNRRNYFQDFMNVASNQWSDIDVGRYARQWVNTVGSHTSVKPASRYILAQDSNPAAKPFDSLPLDYYATGIQYLYGRKAWDASTYFMWQMGGALEGVGHGHIDIGNFNIWRGGRWLTRETTGYLNKIKGYGYKDRPVDDTNGMIAHNGIVFGTALYVDDVKLMPSLDEGQTVVRRLESQPGYVYADVDMTNRYLWRSNHSSYSKGAVVHVEREFLFLRDLECTVILDRVTTGDVTLGPDAGMKAANQVNTFLIHLETNPDLEDATHLTARNGGQALRMTTLVPSNPTRRVIDERSCSGCSPVGQFRVELDTAGAAQRYFLHVLQARDADGSNVLASVADSMLDSLAQGTFTVTLRPTTGADTVIVFAKGRTSTGGTVNLAGAGGKALTNGVQGIRYTDAGPFWSRN